TPNPEIVWLCRKDPALASAVADAALVLPDGVGIVYAAKILGRPLRRRLPGIDFAQEILNRLAKSGGSVYLLGAKPGVAELAAQKLAENFPGLRVAGIHDGYFTDETPVIAAINAGKPDFLFVCLGSPKQELWMQRNAKSLDTGLLAGLGGSLDVFAGTVKRAPETWRKLGLEWLHRLFQEPRRLGRMLKLPLFLVMAVYERIRGE
ncbi:MAG: WecB/TagA/CpsF family glycosyltransferase, partial [Firmicutes bacterium]|nr:WecB/TagA/CpsF family glycosyltransferase [Bacillota bacterium]